MHKIMLVDDSPAALAALRCFLDPSTYLVAATESAYDALDLIGTFQPDCIVSDYDMPEVDGASFCKILKADEKCKFIPLIMLTAGANTEQFLAAIEAGADDYVAKDSDMRVIVAKVNAMLRLRGVHEELSQLRRVAGIKQIVATYNHEFNNPLAIAMGNLSYLRGALTDELQLARAQKAYGALERMAVLVRKIRSLRDYVEDNYTESEGMVSLKGA